MPAFQQFRIIGRIPGHHDHRRQVEAVHQQAAGVIGGGVQRPAHEAHALGGQPAPGFAQQGVGGLRIVQAFEKAEGPAGLSGIGIVLLVHNGRDAPHGQPVAQSQKQLAPGRLPERMRAGREQLAVLAFDRGHPERLIRVDGPGQVHKCGQLLFGANRNDTDGHGPSPCATRRAVRRRARPQAFAGRGSSAARAKALSGRIKLAVPTCTAAAPTRMNSSASSALAMPPMPTTGIFTACAACQTQRRATGLMAGRTGRPPHWPGTDAGYADPRPCPAGC